MRSAPVNDGSRSKWREPRTSDPRTLGGQRDTAGPAAGRAGQDRPIRRRFTTLRTLTRLHNRTAFRTNAGDALDEVTLRINVWHDDYNAGRAIVEQIKATFDRSDFALSGGDHVVQMRRTNDSASQHDDGTWQFTVEFLVQICLPSGT